VSWAGLALIAMYVVNTWLIFGAAGAR